ncbi:MAG: hypothetical protein JWO06_3404 [Bacteroidota bacterium]|nr:hypothetical protein [Bacteroidota bacterium]
MQKRDHSGSLTEVVRKKLAQTETIKLLFGNNY